MAVPCWRARVVSRVLGTAAPATTARNNRRRSRNAHGSSLGLPKNVTASTTTSLAITGGPKSPANVQYSMRFQPTDVLLPNIGIFSAILESFLSFVAYDRYQALEYAILAYVTLPVWLFAISNVDLASVRSLQVHEVVAILQSVVKHYVAQRIYQELGFNLLADEVIVAVGCVVMGRKGRKWCRGLDCLVSGVALGLGGLDHWQNVSVIAWTEERDTPYYNFRCLHKEHV